ncbi:MAG: carboxypeptidase M32 [Planifilum fimeticola]
MKEKLEQLRRRVQEIDDLESILSLAFWDQATYMPSGGGEARARQLATLGRISHEKLTDPAIGQLLEDLRDYEKELPADSDEAGLIRVTRRMYEKAVNIPSDFISEFYKHQSDSYHVWMKAREENDFEVARPNLEKTLEYSRQLADFFPGYEHIADPLIDYRDPGMTVSVIRPLFAELRKQLVPLVEAITEKPEVSDACVRQTFPQDKQLAFGLEVIKCLGYDLDRGRQDLTAHPFMIKFSLGDVRITTRVKEDDLREALFSTIHEAGHAMYEQGINREYEGTPLADGASSGVHESQSRLWENIVGRSRGFWNYFYPHLQKVFPGELGSVDLDTFYRAINKVERSLIRTDADEVTYNLHVIMRFDFELDLLEGRLAVRDLPEAWRERMKADLGIEPPDDKTGVLQDMHWYQDMIGGMFQGYTLGNVLSGLFYEAALKAHPEIPSEMERGEFGTLRRWLTENIYRHGSKYTARELVERVTGGPMTIEPYMRYLRSKYGELYGL